MWCRSRRKRKAGGKKYSAMTTPYESKSAWEKESFYIPWQKKIRISTISALRNTPVCCCELSNLKFIRMDAEEITDVFATGEVDRIYLNFSDPWPKDRHAKRRLPSRQFLIRYDEILKKDGRIEFKTDNRDLFDFAVEELPEAGFCAEVLTYDLHADEKLMEGNIMTEYEEKFSAAGNPICKYIIYR